MPIAKAIVETYGGSIEVGRGGTGGSFEVGRGRAGASFSVRLPLAASASSM